MFWYHSIIVWCTVRAISIFINIAKVPTWFTFTHNIIVSIANTGWFARGGGSKHPIEGFCILTFVLVNIAPFSSGPISTLSSSIQSVMHSYTGAACGNILLLNYLFLLLSKCLLPLEASRDHSVGQSVCWSVFKIYTAKVLMKIIKQKYMLKKKDN